MGVPASDSKHVSSRKHPMTVAESSWSRFHEAHLMLEADGVDFIILDDSDCAALFFMRTTRSLLTLIWIH